MSEFTILDALELLGLESPGRIPGMILCPLHTEDTPSCAIYDDHWHCYGCGAGGGVLDLVAKVGGVSRGKARQYIEGGGYDIPDRTGEVFAPKEPVDLGSTFARESVLWGNPWANDARAFVAEKWPHLLPTRLGLWGVLPGGRGRYLMIPHRDAEGRIVGIKTRSVAGPNKGDKRAFTGSTYPQLYYVGPEKVDARNVWLVEGESDTWTAELHVGNSVQVYGLPSGAQTFRPEYLAQLVRGRTRVFVMTDNDDAGNEAAERISQLVLEASSIAVTRSTPPCGHKDWTEAHLAGDWQ